MASDGALDSDRLGQGVPFPRSRALWIFHLATLTLFVAATAVMVVVGMNFRECRKIMPELAGVRQAIAEFDESAVNLVFRPFSADSASFFRDALTDLDGTVLSNPWPEPLLSVHKATVSRMEGLWPDIEELMAGGSVPAGAVLIREYHRDGGSVPGGKLGTVVEGLSAFVIDGYIDYSNAMLTVRHLLDERQQKSFRLINLGTLLYAGSLLFLAMNWGLVLVSRARRKSLEMETVVEDSRKRLAEAQELLMEREKSASLGQMIAGVAHDVNTPLGICVTAVSHLTELVENPDGGSVNAGDLAEALRIVRSNLDRAVQLISGFKRVSADGVGKQRRIFELESYLAGDLLPSLRPILRKRGHSLEFDGPDSPVMMDSPGEIAEVIANLVLNASFHAYDEGKPGTVWVSVRPDGDRIELAVADTGRGMDEETLLRVYDPFFTTSREQGGTGLGLAIVYNIVKFKLRGDIRCTSAPGSGTAFSVSLPVLFRSGPLSDV